MQPGASWLAAVVSLQIRCTYVHLFMYIYILLSRTVSSRTKVTSCTSRLPGGIPGLTVCEREQTRSAWRLEGHPSWLIIYPCFLPHAYQHFYGIASFPNRKSKTEQKINYLHSPQSPHLLILPVYAHCWHIGCSYYDVFILTGDKLCPLI